MKIAKNRLYHSILTGLLPILIVALLYASVFPLQFYIDEMKATWEEEEELLYLPSGKVIKMVSLGFDEVAADILYIKMIDYFGTHMMTDRNYEWLYHMADLVTTLDPHFKFPYLFAGLMLNVEAKQFINARAILVKGLPYFPDDWYFPFLLGLNYFWNEADLTTAAYYLENASELPDSPTFLKGFAEKLKKEGRTKETTLEFLYALYDSFPSESTKEILLERIREIEAEQ